LINNIIVLEKNGFAVSGNVDSKNDYLLVGSKPGKNLVKAEKLVVKKLDFLDLLRMLVVS